MGIQILCIGTELLVGQTVNTNLAFLATELDAVGLVVDKEVALPDDRALMAAGLRQALAEAELVITVGGLGPTQDDLTRELAAQVIGQPLDLHEATAARIRELYARRGLVREESIRRQASLPRGSDVIPNDWGSAPGTWCEYQGAILVLLPGPPRELKPMFSTYVLPRVRERLPPRVRRVTLATFGVPESLVEERTVKAIAPFPEVEPAYCIKIETGKCLVRLSATVAHTDKLAAAEAAVRAEFGRDLGRADQDLVDMVAAPLRARGWRLGTAESCTGGGIAKLITDTPGISDVFAGGVVTYTNELKTHLLGVQEETLRTHGAVSRETVEAMVRGLAARYGVQAGIAVTGIAGPSGGTPEKPVGTVHIATIVDGDVRATAHRFSYDRASVRDRSVQTALNQLRAHLLARLG